MDTSVAKDFTEASIDLYLLSELITGRRSPSNIASAQLSALIQLAWEQGLAAYLWWYLEKLAFDLPESERLELSAIVNDSIAHYLIHEAGYLEVEGALHRAGIPTIWLKGFALAHSIYPDPSLRPMGDLDVLIPFEEREAALAAVQDIGYHFYGDESLLFGRGDDLFLYTSHHYHLRKRQGSDTILELHYRLLGRNREFLPEYLLAWFWSETETLNIRGRSVESLRSEACLLYLCAHSAMQHGVSQTRLVNFLDIHLLISKQVLDWQTVIQQAVKFHWTSAVTKALRTTQEYFATDIPEEVFEVLRAQRSLDETSDWTYRVQGRGSQWERIRTLFTGMSGTMKIRAITRILVPPPTYMRHRYAVTPGQVVWPYYLKRWLAQMKVVVWALWDRMTIMH